jgi:heme/copper-type cytochrome/quinol oxidase subunit 1
MGHRRNTIEAVIFSLHLAGISSLLGGMNFIVTSLNIRNNPLFRCPLFV